MQNLIFFGSPSGNVTDALVGNKKKEPEHEIINRELLIPHKFLLTIQKNQKLLFKRFQASLRENYLTVGKISLYSLGFVFLIETLILATADSVYSQNSVIIMTLRGIFNFFIFVTVFLFGQTNWKEVYMKIILGVFSFGVAVNVLENYYISYREIFFVKLAELIVIVLVFINLQY